MNKRGRKPMLHCPDTLELRHLHTYDARPMVLCRHYGVGFKTMVRWLNEIGIAHEPRLPLRERSRGWAIIGYLGARGDKSNKVVPSLYTVWVNFRRRCTTDSPIYYRWYKAKGIKVCPEWNDYATFRAWALANGFRKGLQIDRRDGNRGYEPANCRWVTREVQMQNRTFAPRRPRHDSPVPPV